MAISRAALLKELLPGLNELFGMEYENYETTWAVYADYQQHDMTWQVKKIVPWLSRDPKGSDFNVHKITDAMDEIAALKKFTELTKCRS